MADIKQDLQTFLRKVWAEQSTDTIMAMLHSEAKIAGLEEVRHESAEEFLAFHRMVFRLFSEVRVDLRRTVVEGDWIAATAKISGVVRSSGERVSAPTQMMVRIVDGKIVQGYNIIDFIPAFEVMGLLPERTVDQCLMGRRPVFPTRH